jgi:hypothetical protein
MAQDIVGGLFGITPEMYQQNVGENILQQGVQMGQLAPDAFGRANVYAGAAQLGRGISGVMGAQDPQLRLISARNAIFSRTDPNDPDSLARAANELAPFDPQGATALANQAREAAFKLSQVTKNLRERAGADPLQQLIRAGKYTPESIAEYAKTEDVSKLVTIEKPEKQNVKEVGVAAGTREAVYLDVNNDQQFVYQKGADGKQMRVPYFGGIDRVTSTTKVDVDKGETEFIKRLGAKDADRVDAAMSMRESSVAALNSLNRLNQLDQNALISGSFANGRVGATNLLNTLGLTSAKDQDMLAKSENYQKTAGDVILATLGGKLGAGFSNEDRRFIQSLVPQLENSAQARKQLIEFMVKKNQTIVGETTRLENYARENKGLKGFVPTIPLFVGQQPTTSGALQSMSTEQLQQMLKNAK